MTLTLALTVTLTLALALTLTMTLALTPTLTLYNAHQAEAASRAVQRCELKLGATVVTEVTIPMYLYVGSSRAQTP